MSLEDRQRKAMMDFKRAEALSELARTDAFLTELAEVGRKYGVGLTGDFQAFLMEPEDYLFDYSQSADGYVQLGGLVGDANRDPGAGVISPFE